MRISRFLYRISARRRGDSGVHSDSTPIARRNVPTYNPDGTFCKYIARAEALQLAGNERADWATEHKLELNFRAEVHIPRGKLGLWQPKQSGIAGPLVLQYT
jgi:hypothetical protein